MPSHGGRVRQNVALQGRAEGMISWRWWRAPRIVAAGDVRWRVCQRLPTAEVPDAHLVGRARPGVPCSQLRRSAAAAGLEMDRLHPLVDVESAAEVHERAQPVNVSSAPHRTA
jgi:hypothetical protein